MAEPLLTAADLLAAGKKYWDERTIPVLLDGYGQIYVRELMAAEFDERKKAEDDQGMSQATMNARFVCAVICDKDGNRTLDENNPEHLEFARKLPLAQRNKIMQATVYNKQDHAGN